MLSSCYTIAAELKSPLKRQQSPKFTNKASHTRMTARKTLAQQTSSKAVKRAAATVLIKQNATNKLAQTGK
jgi:hypothetical protein